MHVMLLKAFEDMPATGRGCYCNSLVVQSCPQENRINTGRCEKHWLTWYRAWSICKFIKGSHTHKKKSSNCTALFQLKCKYCYFRLFFFLIWLKEPRRPVACLRLISILVIPLLRFKSVPASDRYIGFVS